MIRLFSIFIMSKMLISCRLSHAVIVFSMPTPILSHYQMLFHIFHYILAALSLSPSDILLTFFSFTHKPTILIWIKKKNLNQCLCICSDESLLIMITVCSSVTWKLHHSPHPIIAYCLALVRWYLVFLFHLIAILMLTKYLHVPNGRFIFRENNR